MSADDRKAKNVEHQRAYREANREKLLAAARANYAANREKFSAKNRAYRQENREKEIARRAAYKAANPDVSKAYYEANRDKVLERTRDYNQRNREEVLARGRDYYEKNRDRVAARGYSYREEKRDVIRARSERYRRAAGMQPGRPRPTAEEKKARKAARAGLRLTLRWDVLKGGRCEVCGWGKADGVKLHLDHIVPISKGGTNDRSNLQALCSDCNLGKSDSHEPAGSDTQATKGLTVRQPTTRQVLHHFTGVGNMVSDLWLLYV